MKSDGWLRVAIMVGLLVLPAAGAANEVGRGSVRHSSGKRASSPARTASGAVVSPDPASRKSARAGYRAGKRQGYRRGYRQGHRRGYRRGRYYSWHDARRDYWRWRSITGLFRLGVYVATRPRTTTTVVVTGTTYHYAGGVYYVRSGSGYVVVAAPPGAVVYSVPTYTTTVYVGATEYLYVDGTYYVPTTKSAERPSEPPPTASAAAAAGDDSSDIPMMEAEDDNFEVVSPPVGATVPYLPEDAYEESIDGKRYFVFDGTYYRPFAGEDETIYMVVEDPRAT